MEEMTIEQGFEKIAQVEKQVMQLNESGGLEPLDEE